MHHTRLKRHFGARLKQVSLVSAVTLAAILWLSASPVHSCRCRSPQDWGFIGPETGRLPANAAGVAWYAGRRGGFPPTEVFATRFTLEAILGPGESRQLPVRVTRVEDFPGVYVIGPRGESLKAGATYRFTVDKVHPHYQKAQLAHRQVEVTIDPGILSSRTLLSLDVGPTHAGVISVPMAVSCSTSVHASQVRIEAKLPREARAWAPQLLYRTIVDDRGLESIWLAQEDNCDTIPPGRSWEAVGRDRVYATCRAPHASGLHFDGGLEPGRHALMMQAFLPGTDLVLQTAVRTVNLRCPWW